MLRNPKIGRGQGKTPGLFVKGAIAKSGPPRLTATINSFRPPPRCLHHVRSHSQVRKRLWAALSRRSSVHSSRRSSKRSPSWMYSIAVMGFRCSFLGRAAAPKDQVPEEHVEALLLQPGEETEPDPVKEPPPETGPDEDHLLHPAQLRRPYHLPGLLGAHELVAREAARKRILDHEAAQEVLRGIGGEGRVVAPRQHVDPVPVFEGVLKGDATPTHSEEVQA